MERTQTPGRDRVCRDRGRARALDFRTRQRASRRRARGNALVDLRREQPDDADRRRLQRAFRGRAGDRGQTIQVPTVDEGAVALTNAGITPGGPAATDTVAAAPAHRRARSTRSSGARLSRRSGPRTVSPSRTSQPRTASTRQASWSREPVFRFRRRPRPSCPPGWAAFLRPRATSRSSRRLPTLGMRCEAIRSRTMASTSTRQAGLGVSHLRAAAKESTAATSRARVRPANPPGDELARVRGCGRPG